MDLEKPKNIAYQENKLLTILKAKEVPTDLVEFIGTFLEGPQKLFQN